MDFPPHHLFLAISQDALVLDRVEQQALQNWENSCPLAKV